MASCVYLSQQLPASTKIENVINSVKDLTEKDSVNLCTLQFLVPSSSYDDECRLPSISEWFVSLCRQYRLMCNPRFTVLSHSDVLHIIQLGVAHKNKLAGGAFEAQNEAVFQILEKIGQLKLIPISTEHGEITQMSTEHGEMTTLSTEHGEMTSTSTECNDKSDIAVVMEYYQSFLTSSNHVDLFDVYKAVTEEMEKESDLQKDLAATTICCFGSPTTAMEKKMLHLLCPDGETTSLQLDLNDCVDASDVDIIEEVEPQTENLISQDTQDNVYTTAQTFIYQTVLSYIHLLVNSRSELALSHIFNIPDRDLNHEAFTAVKREAKKKNMPMYQTLTSFVMRLRLGGRGYVPNKSCTLLPHVKGFSLLMGMVHKLQGLVEENPDISSACCRVISVIKNNLGQCGVCKFRKEDLELVAMRIHGRITAIIDENERKAASSPDKPASEGGSLTSRRSLRVFQQLLDWAATSSGEDDPGDLHLDSIALNPNTPTRIPCLLSQFRSPVISDDSPLKQPVKQKGLKDKNNLKRQSKQEIVLPCGEKLRQMDLQSVLVIPSKTLISASEETQEVFKGLCINNVTRTKNKWVSKDKENDSHQESEVQKPSKKAKLAASSPKIAGSIVDKKVNKAQPTKKKAPVKSCRRRLLPQVEGQKQITSFFRL